MLHLESWFAIKLAKTHSVKPEAINGMAVLMTFAVLLLVFFYTAFTDTSLLFSCVSAGSESLTSRGFRLSRYIVIPAITTTQTPK